jgi:hypothetical protein
MNQTGYLYKIYAFDTRTTTTTANLGKGQEVGQTQLKTNPCDVEPSLGSIGFNKLVASATGDTTAGYTTATIQTAYHYRVLLSNINSFNFDVVSEVGYLA